MSGRGPPRGANRSGARARGKCARAAAPRVARTAQRGRGAAARGVAADQPRPWAPRRPLRPVSSGDVRVTMSYKDYLISMQLNESQAHGSALQPTEPVRRRVPKLALECAEPRAEHGASTAHTHSGLNRRLQPALWHNAIEMVPPVPHNREVLCRVRPAAGVELAFTLGARLLR